MDGLVAAIEKAQAQYGFITTAQFQKLGVHPNGLTRLVRAGIWIRVRPGLYQLAGVHSGWRGRMMAACLQAGPDAVISHRSAAALWGLEGFEPPWTLDITVPPDRRPRIDRARVHRRRIEGRSVRDGIPLTPVPDTILDLCAVSREPGIPCGRSMTSGAGSW